ncbi:MAG: nuclear transport factor 2 family protein [Sphingomonas sp.]
MSTPPDPAALQAVIDRMQIEDLFVRYYSGLGGGDPDGFGAFFVEGAELDVNGVVAHGREEIGDLYRAVAIDKPNLTGVFRMILSNVLIQVDGDTATARMMWTQTLNDTIKGPPRLIEQGLEYDRLVKQGGKWKIEKRVVIADSGLPDMMDETYAPRADYSVADL